MNKMMTVRKTAYFLVCLLGAAYLVASCSSEDTAQIVADEFVSIAGTINNLDDAAEPGVAIEGVYGSPGDALNPVTESNATGSFSLEVFSNTTFFLHATKTSFATINTARTALSNSITADPVEIPDVNQAQLVINTAFDVEKPLLVNHAWLVVEVVDANDNEVIGKSISIPPTFSPLGEVYTDCDGTDSHVNETTGPCPAGRQGPMYIAYFDSEGEVDITVGGQKQIAPIRMGEIAVLEFVVAANEFFTVSGTVNDITGNPKEGVDVEAVYTDPGDFFNPTTKTNNVGIYSLQVLKNKTTYLHITQDGYVKVNTLKVELNADLAGMEISLPTLHEAQAVIDTALGAAPELGSKAWLTIDVFDGSGAEQSGVTISPTPIPDLVVYTDCDGTDSGLVVTKTCNPGRDFPMYIAYYDLPGNVSVAVNNKETQTAPLRMGEITYLEF